MDRLFIIGDSWTRWIKPYHHWVRYLTNHYEVHNYGKAGLNNNQIIHRLSRIPSYKSGDRLILFLTEPGRLPLEYYGELNKPKDRLIKNTDFKNRDRYLSLSMVNLEESEKWENNQREDEVNFIKLIKDRLYKQYDPILLTWSPHLQLPLKDYVDLMEVTTNHDEGVSVKTLNDGDLHPGPRGCYEIYKHLHKKLGVQDTLIEFQVEVIDKSLL